MYKLPIILTSALFLLLITQAPVSADYLYDRTGALVPVDGRVLGDDDVQEEQELEIEDSNTPDSNSHNRASEDLRESEKRAEEQRREQSKKDLEKQIEARQKIQEKTNTRSRLEVESENGKLKLKQELTSPNGRTTKRELELQPQESLYVENEQGEHTELKAKLLDPDLSSKGKIELIKSRIKSETPLPITVNENNQLILTKQDGSTKILTVLPDEAKTKFVEQGFLSSDTESVPELTTNLAGDPVYAMSTLKERYVFGLFKLDFKTKSELDVESGEITTDIEETSPWRQLLFRLSR